jgi:small subunit ribosomal protein S15
MSLDRETKTEIIQQFQHHGTDTGSVEVQVALLTNRINDINKHLATHKKDHHSKRGLLLMVSQRRRFLTYLQKHNYAKYQEVIKALGLRK